MILIKIRKNFTTRAFRAANNERSLVWGCMNQTVIRGRRSILYTFQRTFSTLPEKPKVFFSKLRDKINKTVLRVVKNEKKQQESFLFFHHLAIFCVFFSVYDKTATLFAFLFQILFFLACFFSAKLLCYFWPFQKFKYFLVLGFGILVIAFLYYSYYITLFFFFVLFLIAFVLKKYVEEQKTAIMIGFLKDSSINEDHFGKTFKLVLFFNIYNVFLTLFCFYSISLVCSRVVPLSSFLNHQFLLDALTVIFVTFWLNGLLISAANWILVVYYNSFLGIGTSFFFNLISFVGCCINGLLMGFFVLRFVSLGLLANPIDLSFVHAYQKYVLGYSSHDVESFRLVSDLHFFTAEKPPIDVDGFIDKEKTQVIIKEFTDEIEKEALLIYRQHLLYGTPLKSEILSQIVSDK